MMLITMNAAQVQLVIRPRETQIFDLYYTLNYQNHYLERSSNFRFHRSSRLAAM